MPNLRVIAPTVIQAATLSCSPAESSLFPVANLKTHRRDELLRSTSLATQRIRATWAANQTIQAVALCRHNLSVNSGVQVTLFSDAAWTTSIAGFVGSNFAGASATGMTGFDTTYSAGYRGFKNSVQWFASAATNVRSMEITVQDSTNTDGYMEHCMLIAGPMFSPPGTENFEFGHPMLLMDDSTQKRGVGGTLDTVVNTNTIDRQWTFDLRLMRQSTRDWFYDLARTHGKRTPFFLSMYPADTDARRERDHQALVKFTDLSGFERPNAVGYGSTFSVGEC